MSETSLGLLSYPSFPAVLSFSTVESYYNLPSLHQISISSVTPNGFSNDTATQTDTGRTERDRGWIPALGTQPLMATRNECREAMLGVILEGWGCRERCWEHRYWAAIWNEGSQDDGSGKELCRKQGMMLE